jgi:ribonuclease HI
MVIVRRPRIIDKLLGAREAWRDIGGEELVLRGITAEWKDGQAVERLRRLRRPEVYRCSPKMVTEYMKLLDEELKEGIVVEIKEEEAKWINPTFLVPKGRTGKYRKVLDCKVLNDQIADVHFTMDGAETVCDLIRPDDWATSIDIQGAFNHVPVDREFQPYLAFQFQGKTYMYAGMPFGVKHAPLIFTLLMRKVMVAVRERFGVRAISYMDDILLLFDSVVKAVTQTTEIVTFIENLGWTLNAKKCELDPMQDIDFLGWRWHLEESTVSSTPGKKHELLNSLAEWRTYAWEREPRPIRELASLIGKINFMRLQVPDAGLHIKRLDQAKSTAVRLHGWDGDCVANPSMMGDLKWWSKTVAEDAPRHLQKPPVIASLTTDASPQGWGAVLIAGDKLRIDTYSHWTWSDRTLTSNAKEMRAVELALLQLKDHITPLAPGMITVHSDNTVTVSDINRQSASDSLAPVLRSLLATARQMGIQLQAVHIAGAANDEADRLSRIGTRREYFLKESAYEEMVSALQIRPEIDAFAATPYLPSQVSPEHIGEALRQSWRERVLLLHPPVHKIVKTVMKAYQEKAKGILIIPDWRGQPWGPVLSLIARRSIRLGTYDTTMITTPRFKSEGWRLPPGDVLAVLLDGRTTPAENSSRAF